jgi:hypothetical protein
VTTLKQFKFLLKANGFIGAFAAGYKFGADNYCRKLSG